MRPAFFISIELARAMLGIIRISPKFSVPDISILRIIFHLLLLASSVFLAISVHAQDSENYLSELKKEVIERELYMEPRWWALLHYWDNWFLPGYTSFADDSEFFLSSLGKTNAREELLKTIDSIFLEQVDSADKHSQCLFPARLKWLVSELNIDLSRLPKVSCAQYRSWREALDAKKLTLVFPATYLNSPASSFGHTFLRIDSSKLNSSNRPLAYTANYGAETGNSVGLSYALKGIVGAYQGTFSVAPYYRLIKQYNDIESRDIWEYELNFSEDEIDYILAHLWELKGRGFDYYFFSENCSFLLLSLFDVARPELGLQKKFPFWAIPLDTLRSVIDEPGLLARAEFRPSAETRLEFMRSQLSEGQQNLVLDIVEGREPVETIESLEEESRSAILELATDYFSLLNNSGKIALSPEESRKRGYGLLLARSKQRASRSSLLEPPIPKTRPDEGHLTKRLSIAGGEESDRLFYDLGIRPAYHDLLDPGYGRLPGSELRFFELLFRGYEEDGVDFQRFAPLTIKSITPYNRFTRNKSWNFELALERRRVAIDDHVETNYENILRLDAGLGVATSALGGKAVLYGFTQVVGEYENDYRDNHAVGAGLVLGSFLDISDDFRLKFDVEAYEYLFGEQHQEWNASIQSAYQLSRNISFKFGFEREEKNHLFTERVRVGIDYFF